MKKFTYNAQVVKKMLGEKTDWYNRHYLELHEKGVRISHPEGKYVDPDDALQLAYGIWAYYTIESDNIKKEREAYVKRRKEEDFLGEVNLLYKNILHGMRTKLLDFDKRGRNRGFTCKNCDKKYTTENPEDVKKEHIYLYYGVDHSQTMSHWDYEQSIMYMTEAQKKELDSLEEVAMSFTGRYCSEECATEYVTGFFMDNYPEAITNRE